MILLLAVLAACGPSSDVATLPAEARVEYAEKCHDLAHAQHLKAEAMPMLRTMEQLAATSKDLDRTALGLRVPMLAVAELVRSSGAAHRAWTADLLRAADTGLTAMREASVHQGGRGLTVLRHLVEQSLPDQSVCQEAEARLLEAHSRFIGQVRNYLNVVSSVEAAAPPESRQEAAQARQQAAAMLRQAEGGDLPGVVAAWRLARAARVGEVAALLDRMVIKAQALARVRAVERSRHDPVPMHVLAADALDLARELRRRRSLRHEELTTHLLPCLAQAQSLRDLAWARARLWRWKRDQGAGIDMVLLAQIDEAIGQSQETFDRARQACGVHPDGIDSYKRFLQAYGDDASPNCAAGAADLLAEPVEPEDFLVWYRACGPA